MSSLLLIRAPGKSATFSRTVRDEKGNVVKTIDFSPGVPVLVEGDDLIPVMRDIGNTIFICEQDENNPSRINVLYRETSAFVEAELGIEKDLSDLKKGHVKRQGENILSGDDPGVEGSECCDIPGCEHEVDGEPSDEDGDEDVVELDADIAAVLELPENVEMLGGEVTPDAVIAFAKENQLTDLKEIGPGRAKKIKEVLGIEG